MRPRCQSCTSAALTVAILLLASVCGAFAQQQIALYPDVYANASNTGFGVGVAVLSRAGSVLAVSAEFMNNNSGGAYVFSCDSGACALSQIVTLGAGLPGDLFSHGLALSCTFAEASVGFTTSHSDHPRPPRAADGKTIALGAPGRGSSTGAVFTAACSDGGMCGALSELTLPDGVAGDGFGFALALSGDGSVLIVGADGRNGGNGTVLVYSCSGGVVRLACLLLPLHSPQRLTSPACPPAVRLAAPHGAPPPSDAGLRRLPAAAALWPRRRTQRRRSPARRRRASAVLRGERPRQRGLRVCVSLRRGGRVRPAAAPDGRRR